MKELEKHLKTGSGNLRGADESVLESVLGVKKGSVCLFSLLNDTEKKVSLLLDHRLANECNHIGFHPMQNDATTSITKEDLLKIVELSGHKAEVVDFTKMVPQEEEKKAVKKEENKESKDKKKAGEGPVGHELSIQYKKEENFSKWYQ